MRFSLGFIRFFFIILSTFFITTFMVASPKGSLLSNTVLGISVGISFSLALIVLDTFFRKWKLRSFSIVLLGLLFGYLMSQALLLSFNTLIDITSISIHAPASLLEFLKLGIVLFSLYLGTIMVHSSSKELAVSIPFVNFQNKGGRSKTVLPDLSTLCDSRIIDLASSGLLDQQIVVPKFLVEELYVQMESYDDPQKTKARKCLETLKKLEGIPSLGMQYIDIDFPDVKDITNKLLRVARKTDSHILTLDINRIQIPVPDSVRIINLNTLSSALKPSMQTGEVIKIKIQRFGKEPKQGVGYLEDGTMVVVNGAGNCIGEIIDAQVLSVKHTNSGRLVFCNAYEEDALCQEYENELLHEQ
ncbi:MAG: TRAM domain-containing protein [Chlamydiae bacterium]|nr:TRAM domain-containing protein [Chlamydiota bacterium]